MKTQKIPINDKTPINKKYEYENGTNKKTLLINIIQTQKN
jgi:hypothetical protein